MQKREMKTKQIKKNIQKEKKNIVMSRKACKVLAAELSKQ